MHGWTAVILFAAISGVAGLAGVWLMWRHEALARRHTPELITFASGLLVAGSLLHLLPRAGEIVGGQAAMAWALAAFVALYIAENHFLPHPHARTDEDGHARKGSEGEAAHLHETEGFGWAAVAGLALHGVLDGIAVGAGFSTSLLTGGIIVSLVVSHKLPVGIATMGVLYHGGEERGRAVRYSAAVAMITPVAVLGSYGLLRDAGGGVLGALVAAAGGSFLYVGAADLLPEGQATGRRRTTLAFLLGLALILVALLLLPHETIV